MKPFPRFTVHPRSSDAPVSLPPAELAPSYFHASLTVQPSSAQAISTLHSPFTTLPSRSLQRRPPKLFPRFTIHPSSSGVPASLPPAKLPPSYFQRFTVEHSMAPDNGMVVQWQHLSCFPSQGDSSEIGFPMSDVISLTNILRFEQACMVHIQVLIFLYCTCTLHQIQP